MNEDSAKKRFVLIAYVHSKHAALCDMQLQHVTCDMQLQHVTVCTTAK